MLRKLNAPPPRLVLGLRNIIQKQDPGYLRYIVVCTLVAISIPVLCACIVNYSCIAYVP